MELYDSEVSYLNDNNVQNIQNNHDPNSSQNSGLFTDQVNKINEKIDFMANRIRTLSKDLDTRLTALGDLIQVRILMLIVIFINLNYYKVVQTGRKSSIREGSRQTRSMTNKSIHTPEQITQGNNKSEINFTSTSTTITTNTTASSSSSTSSSLNTISTKKRENPLQALKKTLSDS